MRLSKISACVAAISVMAAAPAFAASQAAPASKLSLSSVNPTARVGVSSKRKSKQEGGSIAIAVLAVAAVAGGVIAATSDGGDSN